MNCNSQDKKLKGLENCLEKEEIQILNDGLVGFESELAKLYPKLEKEESYIEFISDFTYDNIPLTFFLNPELESTRNKIRKLGIWTLSDHSDDGMGVEIRLDGAKPDKSIGFLTLTNEFQNCIIDKISSNGIKNFIKIRGKVPNISPRISAVQIYDGYEKEEFENELNRLAIVLGVFYEFSLNLEN